MGLEALSAAAGATTALSAALNIASTAIRIKDVPEDSLVFARLVRLVHTDYVYADACRRDLAAVVRKYPDLQDRWISDILKTTRLTLEDFGQYVLKAEGSVKSPSLDERVKYILRTYQKLVDRTDPLQIAHSRLLCVINFLNMLLVQGVASAGALASASSARSPPSGRQPHRALHERPVGSPQLSPSAPLALLAPGSSPIHDYRIVTHNPASAASSVVSGSRHSIAPGSGALNEMATDDYDPTSYELMGSELPRSANDGGFTPNGASEYGA